MKETAIKIDHLTKVYKIFDKPTDRVKEALHPFGKRYSKDFYALNDVSFEIKRGETVGIIGKNGAGKSTLLKIITGVLTPTSGTVQVNGRIASLLELGAGFNPEMTGIENIYLSGSLMGYSKEKMDDRLQDIVDFADIGDFIYQPVKMYSSGMFARLAFAVNVSVEPDILIVDEALSVGDVFFQNKCFKKMEEMKNRGITILFVSHDMASLRLLCKWGIWLANGKAVESGDMKALSEAYFNAELAEANAMKMASVEKLELQNQIEVKESKENITVPPLKKSNGIFSDKVEIKSFFFEHRGEITNILKVEEKYSANMLVEIKQDVENLIFGFIMENVKGVCVMGFNTFMFSDGKGIEATKGTILKVAFEFNMPMLRRDTYLISPAVAKGTQEQHVQLTWLENSSVVEVINDGFNNSLIEIPCKQKVMKYLKENVSYL